MVELSIGDRVLAGDAATGALTYQPVYLIPHHETDVKAAYVSLAVAGDLAPLRLSPRHFIPVCKAQPCSLPGHWEARYAREVQVGDVIRAVKAGQSGLDLVAVERTWLSVEQGAFNPFVVGGTLVVNGVLASDQSEWILDDLLPASMIKHIPAIYAALVAPARWAFWALGAERWAVMEAAVGVSWVGHNYGKAVLVYGPLALVMLLLTAPMVSRRLR